MQVCHQKGGTREKCNFKGCLRAIWYFEYYFGTHFPATIFTFCLKTNEIYLTSACTSVLCMDYLKFHGWNRKCPPIPECPI